MCDVDIRRDGASQRAAADRRLQRESDDTGAGVHQLRACAATAAARARHVSQHVLCARTVLHVYELVCCGRSTCVCERACVFNDDTCASSNREPGQVEPSLEQVHSHTRTHLLVPC